MRITALVVLIASVGLFAADSAQRGRRGFTRIPERIGPLRPYDGSFRFCRISFRNSVNGDGDGWFVDYPRADENLSVRLSELTKAPVAYDADNTPVHVVFPLTDPDLFTCGFVMMTEPGGADFDADEAKQLRMYLLKGGFLWADDFWGSYAWDWWAEQIAKALPHGEYPIFDVPMNHQIFHMLYDIDRVPQIPNIGLWARAHLTSERGSDSAEVHFRGIADHAGRLMVVMTHDTDFGDAYERESEDPDYFRRFSVPGYAIGVDIILYSMTH